MEYLGIENYLGYLLMLCIVNFVLILCMVLSLQDKKIKRHTLSEITKDRTKLEIPKVWDMQGTVKYTKGDNT